jgi:primosomal protein N' (replication factor Y) (superfamily II helicase)
MAPTIARVAVPVPVPSLFDYRVPFDRPVTPGCRVRVPFGRGHRTAVVVELADATRCPDERLKDIAEVLDEAALLGLDDLAFLVWAAAYYHHPVGEVIATALPLRLRRGRAAEPPGEPGWRLTDSGAAAWRNPPTRAPRRQAILAALADAGGALGRRVVAERFPTGGDALRVMRRAGWILDCRMPALPDPLDTGMPPGPVPNPGQLDAIASIRGLMSGFGVALLDGVTGSGKTEVYLHLAQTALAKGRGVMVLVPEISLTPQLERRFRARLGETVRVLHSGLGDSERESAWHRLRLGLSRVLLGTRSSVFTPVADLGLVIVDEEHDGSYKQGEGFRYSARDLAIVRGKRAGCAVVLGSATPSLESLRHALDGRYVHVRLDRRAGTAQPPRVGLLDLRDQPVYGGIAQPMLDRIAATLAADEQAIVFLNRRGYAPVLCCYACGWLSDCPHCDARQTVHRHNSVLWCHHCGRLQRLPQKCPQCGAGELNPLGQGTEQVEDVLAARFPDWPLIRIDRDSTARKGSLEDKLAQIRDATGALLVGTQMLAKGHHFPRVTLVGVLDADGGLFSADFRAAERMAQLLEQVGGRAGRAERPGQVLIQTRYPDHPLLQTLVRQGYRAFAREALREREAAALPPFAHQALLRAEGSDPDAPAGLLEAVAAGLRGTADGVDVWGPVPAPMPRRAGRYRVHLLLQAARRESLHRALRPLPGWIAGLPQARRVRWSLDVDPVDLF